MPRIGSMLEVLLATSPDGKEKSRIDYERLTIRHYALKQMLREILDLHTAICEKGGEYRDRDLDNLEENVREILSVNFETAEIKVD